MTSLVVGWLVVGWLVGWLSRACTVAKRCILGLYSYYGTLIGNPTPGIQRYNFPPTGVTPNRGMGPPVRRFLSNYFDLLFLELGHWDCVHGCTGLYLWTGNGDVRTNNRAQPTSCRDKQTGNWQFYYTSARRDYAFSDYPFFRPSVSPSVCLSVRPFIFYHACEHDIGIKN